MVASHVLSLELVAHFLLLFDELLIDIQVEAVAEQERILARARPNRLKNLLVARQNRLQALYHVIALGSLQAADEWCISECLLILHVLDLLLQGLLNI